MRLALSSGAAVDLLWLCENEIFKRHFHCLSSLLLLTTYCLYSWTLPHFHLITGNESSDCYDFYLTFLSLFVFRFKVYWSLFALICNWFPEYVIFLLPLHSDLLALLCNIWLKSVFISRLKSMNALNMKIFWHSNPVDILAICHKNFFLAWILVYSSSSQSND